MCLALRFWICTSLTTLATCLAAPLVDPVYRPRRGSTKSGSASIVLRPVRLKHICTREDCHRLTRPFRPVLPLPPLRSHSEPPQAHTHTHTRQCLLIHASTTLAARFPPLPTFRLHPHHRFRIVCHLHTQTVGQPLPREHSGKPPSCVRVSARAARGKGEATC